MRILRNRTYFFVISIFFLASIGAITWMLLLDYDDLVTTVVRTMHKNGLGQKIRNELFTRSRFTLVQKMAWLFFLLLAVCYWLALRFRPVLTSCLKTVLITILQSLQSVARVFSNNSIAQNRQVVILMIVIGLFFIYHMTTAYLNYDEMWSYNYYTDHPFYYSFFTYSNYPLFETTTHFFKWWPFPMKINLRLSPFLFGLASCILIYACMRSYFNSHFIAIAGLTAFAFMHINVIFMVMARGVPHELFFGIGGIFSLLYWIKNLQQKKYLVIYILAGILGVYAMPTHVYLLALLFCIGLRQIITTNKSFTWLFMKTNLFIAAGIMLLYAPMVLVNGTAVLSDVYNKTPSLYKVINAFPRVMQIILLGYTGNSYVNLLLYLAALTAMLLVRKRIAGAGLMITIAGAMPLSTMVIYLITRFPYADRSLAFGALSIPLVTCLLLQAAEPWLGKHSGWAKRTGIAAIIVVLLLNSYRYLPTDPTDKNVAVVANLLIKNNITSCYDNASPETQFFYYYPGIEYYYRQAHQAFEFTLAQKNSMRYKPLLSSDRYDCIVADTILPGNSIAALYHPMYRDAANKFTIWIRKDLNQPITKGEQP